MTIVQKCMAIMSIIITEEDLCKKHAKNVQDLANFQVYPQNVFKPRMIPTLKMTLNPIFVLIIITHAQVFETIKKHGGQGYLAAPYCLRSHLHAVDVVVGVGEDQLVAVTRADVVQLRRAASATKSSGLT